MCYRIEARILGARGDVVDDADVEGFGGAQGVECFLHGRGVYIVRVVDHLEVVDNTKETRKRMLRVFTYSCVRLCDPGIERNGRVILNEREREREREGRKRRGREGGRGGGRDKQKGWGGRERKRE